MKKKKNLKMSSSNCENVPLMFKIDACIELVQTKFMDYSPIKKIYFITIVYYLKFYHTLQSFTILSQI